MPNDQSREHENERRPRRETPMEERAKREGERSKRGKLRDRLSNLEDFLPSD